MCRDVGRLWKKDERDTFMAISLEETKAHKENISFPFKLRSSAEKDAAAVDSAAFLLLI